MKPALTGFIKTASIIVMVVLLCSPLRGGEFHLQLKTRTVYIIPMANGLDRHLASRLTSSAVVWVVLDPETRMLCLPPESIRRSGLVKRSL